MTAGDASLYYLGNGLNNDWVVAFLGARLDQAAESHGAGVLESLDRLVEARPSTPLAAEALDQAYCSLHRFLESYMHVIEHKREESLRGVKGMAINLLGIDQDLRLVFSSLDSIYDLLSQRTGLEGTSQLRGGTDYRVKVFPDPSFHIEWYADFSKCLDGCFNAFSSLSRNNMALGEIRNKIGEQQSADLVDIRYSALPQDIDILKSRIQNIVLPTELFLVRRAYR